MKRNHRAVELVDCIKIGDQPTFDHPLFKIHEVWH
ncbi:hypothetical protein AALP_AA6G283300 [Arabis alpina]|uniref:Neprosin activation peptide domain-containing protein n=1 Tax=Arabis alpina TaxID=50452 RepID=A0A087GS93_ARAAL|nr:hypothetical protein AALP_AA6G283300 [Arabis alpina]